MGKPKVETQEVPDPNQIIETQARVNRVNTVNPFSSTTWSRSGATPVSGPGGKTGGSISGSPGGGEWTQTTNLSPELQAIFNSAIGESLSGAGGAPFEARSLPAPVANVALTSPDSPTFNASAFDPAAIEDAVFERQTRLLEPQFAQRERGLRQNLADRGIAEGDEQYNTLLNQELDAQNRVRSDAALSAVLTGRDFFERDRNFGRQGFESDRLFDASRFEADRQLANVLNQQDFGNRLSLDEGDRAFYLNRGNQNLTADQVEFSRLAQLLGLTPQQPIVPVDATGAYGIANSVAGQNAAAQNAANQAGFFGFGDLLNVGGSLGAAALLASDDTLKTNVKRIGETSKGIPLYSFDWKDGRDMPGVGVLAREVEKVMPEAVHDINGILHVDYSMVGDI